MHPTSFRWTTAVAVLITVSFVQTHSPYNDYRRMRITPKECTSHRVKNLTGICMFNLECQERAGTVIGACVDRFLFGACCHVPNYVPEEIPPSIPLIASSSSTSASDESNESSRPDVSSGEFVAPADQRLPGRAPTLRTTLADSPSPFTHPTVSIETSTARTSSGDRPIRFPIRPALDNFATRPVSLDSAGLESNSGSDETLGPLYSLDPIMPDGERSTVPPPRDIATLLPVPLETFSSVSDPISHGDHGDHHNMFHKNGESHVSLEHSSLTTPPKGGLFSNFHDKVNVNVVKPSVSISTQSASSAGSESLSVFTPSLIKNVSEPGEVTTEPPPKLSTFMYVVSQPDGDLSSVTESVATQNTGSDSADSETIGSIQFLPNRRRPDTSNIIVNENLSSNTENVWSVVMQLAAGATSTELSPQPKEPSLNNLLLNLTFDGNDAAVKNSTNFLLDKLSSQLSSEDDSLDHDSWKVTTTSSVTGGSNLNSDIIGSANIISNVGDDDDVPFSNFNLPMEVVKIPVKTTPESIQPTPKPWASSTYQVHTFKYPEVTTVTSFIKEEQESATTTNSIGGLTTWFGHTAGSPIMTTESKEPEPTKTVEVSNNNVMTSTSSKMSTTLPPLKLTTRMPPTAQTTEKSTTLKTTLRPRPTTEEYIRSTTVRTPYTLPPHKKYTTMKTTMPPKPKTTPKVVRTTPRTTTTSTTTTTTTTPKPKTTKPTEKIVTKKTTPTPSVTESPLVMDGDSMKNPSLLEEDLDTNLDDFVNQVVQGIAGSLDGLDLDEVILPSMPPSAEGPPTLHPLHVLSDPLFPPFPVVGEVPLTKPVKPGKPSVGKPAAGATKLKTPTTTTTTSKPLDYRKDCGVRPMVKSGRIVGGTVSSFGKWPWQALVKEATWLGLFSKNKCGGVLINPKYVLTAAHCQPGFLATLTVVLGDFDISSDTENSNAITKNVRRVIVHRDYNAQTFENDIALLELDSAVDYQQHVVPICLPVDDEPFIGKSAFVTGWGRLKYGGGVPQVLHEVEVPILNNDDCQGMFQKSGHLKAIKESFICAGYEVGLRDSCEGDSGGPLAVQRPNGQWVLAGTVSHGIKCAYPNLPGVYMRMTFYKPWIKRVTGMKMP